jgi:RNase P subunit RPR2
MTVQSACLAFSTCGGRAIEKLGRPNCPRCGSILLMAEESRFNIRGRIDHAWSCDDCGNEFVTSIRLMPRQQGPEGTR